eukprot:4396446-Pyramimonas_sp.AAC.1
MAPPWAPGLGPPPWCLGRTTGQWPAPSASCSQRSGDRSCSGRLQSGLHGLRHLHERHEHDWTG